MFEKDTIKINPSPCSLPAIRATQSHTAVSAIRNLYTHLVLLETSEFEVLVMSDESTPATSYASCGFACPACLYCDVHQSSS